MCRMVTNDETVNIVIIVISEQFLEKQTFTTKSPKHKLSQSTHISVPPSVKVMVIITKTPKENQYVWY